MKWRDLNIRQKSEVIKMAVRNGVTDLNEISRIYDDSTDSKPSGSNDLPPGYRVLNTRTVERPDNSIGVNNNNIVSVYDGDNKVRMFDKSTGKSTSIMLDPNRFSRVNPNDLFLKNSGNALDPYAEDIIHNGGMFYDMKDVIITPPEKPKKKELKERPIFPVPWSEMRSSGLVKRTPAKGEYTPIQLPYLVDDSNPSITTPYKDNMIKEVIGERQYGKGGSIHINPKNRGKFNALKKRTGKTTEELTHSKNPLTRKRAIFAQNARKWHHAYGGNLYPDGGYTYKYDEFGRVINVPTYDEWLNGANETNTRSLPSDEALRIYSGYLDYINSFNKARTPNATIGDTRAVDHVRDEQGLSRISSGNVTGAAPVFNDMVKTANQGLGYLFQTPIELGKAAITPGQYIPFYGSLNPNTQSMYDAIDTGVGGAMAMLSPSNYIDWGNGTFKLPWQQNTGNVETPAIFNTLDLAFLPKFVKGAKEGYMNIPSVRNRMVANALAQDANIAFGPDIKINDNIGRYSTKHINDVTYSTDNVRQAPTDFRKWSHDPNKKDYVKPKSNTTETIYTEDIMAPDPYNSNSSGVKALDLNESKYNKLSDEQKQAVNDLTAAIDNSFNRDTPQITADGRLVYDVPGTHPKTLEDAVNAGTTKFKPPYGEGEVEIIGGQDMIYRPAIPDLVYPSTYGGNGKTPVTVGGVPLEGGNIEIWQGIDDANDIAPNVATMVIQPPSYLYQDLINLGLVPKDVVPNTVNSRILPTIFKNIGNAAKGIKGLIRPGSVISGDFTYSQIPLTARLIDLYRDLKRQKNLDPKILYDELFKGSQDVNKDPSGGLSADAYSMIANRGAKENALRLGQSNSGFSAFNNLTANNTDIIVAQDAFFNFLNKKHIFGKSKTKAQNTYRKAFEDYVNSTIGQDIPLDFDATTGYPIIPHPFYFVKKYGGYLDYSNLFKDGGPTVPPVKYDPTYDYSYDPNKVFEGEKNLDDAQRINGQLTFTETPPVDVVRYKSNWLADTWNKATRSEQGYYDWRDRQYSKKQEKVEKYKDSLVQQFATVDNPGDARLYGIINNALKNPEFVDNKGRLNQKGIGYVTQQQTLGYGSNYQKKMKDIGLGVTAALGAAAMPSLIGPLSNIVSAPATATFMNNFVTPVLGASIANEGLDKLGWAKPKDLINSLLSTLGVNNEWSNTAADVFDPLYFLPYGKMVKEVPNFFKNLGTGYQSFKEDLNTGYNYLSNRLGDLKKWANTDTRLKNAADRIESLYDSSNASQVYTDMLGIRSKLSRDLDPMIIASLRNRKGLKPSTYTSSEVVKTSKLTDNDIAALLDNTGRISGLTPTRSTGKKPVTSVLGAERDPITGKITNKLNTTEIPIKNSFNTTDNVVDFRNGEIIPIDLKVQNPFTGSAEETTARDLLNMRIGKADDSVINVIEEGTPFSVQGNQDKLADVVKSNIEFIQEKIPGFKPFGSGTITTAGNPHIPHDFDGYISEDMIPELEKIWGPKKKWMTNDGLTYQFNFDPTGKLAAKGVPSDRTIVDVNIIRNGANGKATGTRAEEIFRQFFPEDYKIAAQKAAEKAAKSGKKELQIPYTARELLDAYDPQVKSLLDSWSSSKSKHVERALHYLTTVDSPVVDRAIQLYANSLVGGKAQMLPITSEMFKDKKVASQVFDMLGLKGIDKNTIINDPNKMSNLVQWWYINNSIFGRGVDVSYANGKNIAKELAANYETWPGTGGSVMGIGENSVTLGNSGHGPFYGFIQPKINYTKSNDVISLINQAKRALGKNYVFTEEERAIVNDLAKKYNINQTFNSTSDILTNYSHSDSNFKNEVKFLQELNDRLGIRAIENSTYGDSNYSSFTGKIDTSKGDLYSYDYSPEIPTSQRIKENAVHVRKDYNYSLKDKTKKVVPLYGRPNRATILKSKVDDEVLQSNSLRVENIPTDRQYKAYSRTGKGKATGFDKLYSDFLYHKRLYDNYFDLKYKADRKVRELHNKADKFERNKKLTGTVLGSLGAGYTLNSLIETINNYGEDNVSDNKNKVSDNFTQISSSLNNLSKKNKKSNKKR